MFDEGVGPHGGSDQPNAARRVLALDELGSKERLAEHTQIKLAGLGLADGNIAAAKGEWSTCWKPPAGASTANTPSIWRAYERWPGTVGTTSSSTSSLPILSQTAWMTSLSADERPRRSASSVTGPSQHVAGVYAAHQIQPARLIMFPVLGGAHRYFLSPEAIGLANRWLSGHGLPSTFTLGHRRLNLSAYSEPPFGRLIWFGRLCCADGRSG